jgi:hypothetical protein
MVKDYINTQKSVMDSIFSSAAPYYENTYRMYSYWFSLRVPTELWARSVSNIVENISTTARINNESYLKALMHGEVHLNEHNNIRKNFQESIQIQQKLLKIQQERQRRSFQLVDKEKSIDRTVYYLVI